MRLILAISTFAIIAACTTAPTPEPDPAPVAAAAVEPTAYELAMQTVDDLAAAQNEQMAIDRIKQLLGTPGLSDSEMAAALMKLGELRYGAGNDVFGAIDAWDELIDTYPASAEAIEAVPLRDTARGEATTLNFAVQTGGLSPTEEFEYLFRLGRHQEAADLMLSRNLTPGNDYLLDMFQIGYLCEDVNLTGPEYKLTEPDGTDRVVQFCEFGK